ncbi:Uncharacterized protein FKW44_015033 [Caligus rogercresseyi]|uniref:DUF7041 domain-containing protein n=1 Tax=Caligus rogercresseyi TaxID=217165 RepID=A0A7T8H0C6_CALRO|nr:Uncharacterized protein FKW44_015033 [Caligus rogercresseyi]
MDTSLVTPRRIMTVKEEDSTTHSGVQHVAVKLPTFTPFRPSAYFIRIEAQFEQAKINREITKFNHLLGAVPENVLLRVPEYALKRCANSEKPYSTFKDLLIKQCLGSKQQLITEVIELSSNKDNLCVSEMETKASDILEELTRDGTDLKEMFIKKLVLGCLPESARQHLNQGFARLNYEDFIESAKTEERMSYSRPYCVKIIKDHQEDTPSDEVNIIHKKGSSLKERAHKEPSLQ